MIGDRGDVRPQQPEQRAVARLPLRLGQRGAVRKDGTEVPGRVPQAPLIAAHGEGA